MGLDSFTKLLITTPEGQSANFDPRIISDIKYEINSMHHVIEEHTELNLANKISLKNENTVTNPNTSNYDTPLFEIVPNDDDYLSRRYWDLANYIVNDINTPVLKEKDLQNKYYHNTEYERDKDGYDYHKFLNVTGKYLNITENLPKIHKFLKNDQNNIHVAMTVNSKLNNLEKYLDKVQTILNRYDNNLKATIVYYEWY